MSDLALQFEKHLNNKILPFWKNLRDKENGGFYGFMDVDLNIDKTYDKGCILNSRILWFFSNAYLCTKDESVIEYADHAFEFLKNYCLDKEFGGVYWAVNYKGETEDSTKHTYNQAFAIYALSSYYDATKNKEALEIANSIYELLEKNCKDEFGYLEAFDREFKPVENDKLSENGIIAEKTMNTLLHVFEAYTEYYRVTKKEEVANQLRWMLDIFADKVYNKELGRQEVFFDREWNTLIDLYSYGHDIETTWLVDLGLEVLNDKAYTEKLIPITKEITKNIYNIAYKDHSLLNEAEHGVVDTRRVWWVQAEAVVGFLNGYEKSPEKKEYFDAAVDIWNYIQNDLTDSREGSEWFWSLDENKKPSDQPIVEPWKCPYHNGRMCFEAIRRLKNA